MTTLSCHARTQNPHVFLSDICFRSYKYSRLSLATAFFLFPLSPPLSLDVYSTSLQYTSFTVDSVFLTGVLVYLWTEIQRRLGFTRVKSLAYRVR
ncbi:hypothetical protein IW261DRAFT_730686 [Armillaria novae-zelandiae]|uniref:Uncharacterized protein n=1 Tax=Armillaria novae-zelandiae TaxID=153914 RepID=A0AA39NVR5_9AGAR|nr:hypothetical protein IW261DRAFT_730686 [Armillaria novae-zelandiae]